MECKNTRCYWRSKFVKQEVFNHKVKVLYCNEKKCEGNFKNYKVAKEFCKYFIESSKD